jgi:hypothetical protein
MAKPVLPVILQIGDTSGQIGTVDVPLVAGPVVRGMAGLQHAEFRVDHDEFRRNVADLLRRVAEEFERGPIDG